MFKFGSKNLIRSVSFVLLLLIACSFIPPLRSPILNILKIPLVLLSAIRHELDGMLFYHRNMVDAERLAKETDILKRKLNQAEEAYLENERLKKILALKQNSSFKVIVASVIGRDLDSWGSVIIINKGHRHGIRKNLAVMSYLGLIGKVIETGDSTSKIMLLNDPAMGVSAVISRSRQEGLVSGTLGNTLVMRYLPSDSDVETQDKVITSGFTPGYPKGLLIGTVVSLGDEFSGLSRYAIIKPAANLSDLEEVLVVMP